MTVKFKPGPAKLHAAKILKDELHIGVKEAIDFADNGEFTCNEEQFSTIKKALAACGAGSFEIL